MKKLLLILLFVLVFAAPSLAQVEIILELVNESILEQIGELAYVKGDLLERFVERQGETHCRIIPISGKDETFYASTCVFDDKLDDRKIIYLNIHSSDERTSAMMILLLFHDLHLVGQSLPDDAFEGSILRVAPPPGRYEVFFLAADQQLQMSFEIE